MLTSMRKYQKYIIFTTAVLFILGMALMGITGIFTPAPKAGKIGGESIKLEDFNNMLQAHFRQFAEENRYQEFSNEQLTELNDEVWDQLVDQKILEKEIKRRKIKATDEDIIEKMKESPDPAIQDFDAFQTDGRFDREKYVDMLVRGEMPIVTLQNGQQLDLALWLEDRARANIPYEKLYEEVIDEQPITEEELRQYYIEENEMADAKVIYFNPGDLEVTVTDEEISAYYEQHKEDYLKPPARKIKYVKLELKPSDADIEAARTEAQGLYDRIRAGEDFAALAREFSEDPGSGANGGDMDFFGRGRMVKPFEDKAFSMRVGQLSRPVETQYGWHIIEKLDERTENGEEQVKVRHILIRTEASDETKFALSEKADDLYELAIEKGIDAAAQQMGLRAILSTEITGDASYISGVGQADELIDFAYGAEIGEVGYPWEDPQGNVYVTALAEVMGEHYDPLSKVSKRIRGQLERDRKAEKVAEAGAEFLAANDPENYFMQAETDGWEVVEGAGIKMTQARIPRIGNQPELNEAILATGVGEWTELVSTNRGAYVAQVTAKTPADMDKFEEEKEEIREELRQKNANEYWEEWLHLMRDRYNVRDYRAKYYEYMTAETPEQTEETEEAAQ